MYVVSAFWRTTRVRLSRTLRTSEDGLLLEHLHHRVHGAWFQRPVEQIPRRQAVVAFGFQQVEREAPERLVGADEDRPRGEINVAPLESTGNRDLLVALEDAL